MKGLRGITASTALFLCMAAAAHAFPGLSMDIAVNAHAPVGDFSDGAETGFGGAFEAFAGLPMLPLKFGGRVAYNRFGHQYNDGSSSVIEILPSMRYGFGLPLGVMSFFGQLGAGAYHWKYELKSPGVSIKTDDTKFGVSLGIGANAMNLLVLPMYHVMFDDDKTSYFSFNIGASF